MIPGLYGGLSDAGKYVLKLTTDELNVDVFVRMGSPDFVVTPTIIISSGVIIGSADETAASLSFVGFMVGSVIRFENKGRVTGKGGDGGAGQENGPSNGFQGGGGGGGAGGNVGLGGSSLNLVDGAGQPGLFNTGGAGGITDITGIPSGVLVPSEDGNNGGDAIAIGSLDIEVDNTAGEIWGGGGGGMGGSEGRIPAPPTVDGILGGDIATDAPGVGDFAGTGFAGFSFRGAGNVIIIPGEEGDIRGNTGV